MIKERKWSRMGTLLLGTALVLSAQPVLGHRLEQRGIFSKTLSNVLASERKQEKEQEIIAVQSLQSLADPATSKNQLEASEQASQIVSQLMNVQDEGQRQQILN